jgi:hypothetical protein
MAVPAPDELRLRGVYAYRDVRDNEFKYIGSTTCTLDKLDYNHRNWFALGYSPTKFRAALTDKENANNWKVEWLEIPELRTVFQVETLEGICIRIYDTITHGFNKDSDPVASSVNYGRYVAARPKLPIPFA